MLGDLESGQFHLAMALYFFFIALTALSQNDKGAERFSEDLVFNPDNANLMHFAQLKDDFFNLFRADAVRAALYHVAPSPDQIQEPLFIPFREVAGMQPAVFEHLLGLCGLVPISDHYV